MKSTLNPVKILRHLPPVCTIGLIAWLLFACSGSSDSWLEKGRQALSADKPKEAIESLNRAIEKNEQNARAFNARGVAYFELKDYTNALLDYEQAIKVQPDWYQPYFNRARLKVEQTDWEGALKDFSEAVSRQPDSSEVYTNRGTVLYNLGRLPEAMHDFDKAIQLKTTDATALFNRGNILFRQRNYPAAIADFEAAVRADSKFGKAFHALGLARISAGNREEGCLSLKQAGRLGYSVAQGSVETYCQ
ncbi:MAG: tetratricopeptide repeat protein [Cytophagaceae bacterium]|nr:tetratricopeptide repeat protein [Cytophagaceae bacterium]